MLHSLFSTARIINNRGSLLFKAIQENNETEVSNILNSYFYPAWSEVQDKDKSQSQTDLFDWGSQSFAMLEALFTRYGSQIFGCDSSEEALCWAAKQGYLSVVTFLLEKCSTEISIWHKGNALLLAADRGHLPIVALLLEKCGTKINAGFKSVALGNAAFGGHLPVVNLLLEKCSTELSPNDKCRAFQYAVYQGDLQVVTFLFEKCATEISLRNKSEEFKNAAFLGHLPIVTFLLEKCSTQIGSWNKGVALYNAAYMGHTTVVTFLLETCSAEIIAADKSKALIAAAKNGHLPALEALVADDSVSAVATWNYNAALREAQTRARLGGQNYVHYQPIVNRLLQIPAVARLVQPQQLAIRARFAENSMQALTGSEKALIERLKHHYAAQYADKSWEVIRAEILSYLEDAYQQSPAKDGYHYVKMLAPGADFYELPADTLVLKPQDGACSAFYEHEGAIQEHSLPLAQVEEIYRANNKSHLLYLTSQDETLCQALLEAYKIPSPYQDQPLPLAYSASLSPSALVAYYRHLIHGAWRYLSHSNPWMDPAAHYVHTLADGQRQAMIGEADKKLLSYFWLALTDEHVQLEPDFTLAGNKNLLAAALAAINRGHNIDERPVNPADLIALKNKVPGIKTTCEDDVKADRPSCSYGVTKRLLENAYGHPYINCPQAQPLDPDILLKRMEAHLVRPKGDKQQQDNLIDKLEKLSLPILQALQHEIAMICDMADEADKIILTPEQEQQKKQALTLSIAQLTAFIDGCKLWFGENRISDLHAAPFTYMQVDQRHKHHSYEAFIHYCATYPLKAFTTAINEAIQTLINKAKASEANKPDAMPITYLADHKRKREESTSSSSGTEPNTPEKPSKKRKRALA